MTPKRFVKAMKAAARDQTKSEVGCYAKPPSPNPPEHLARFSAWYLRQSPADRRIAAEAIRYAREGCLFGLLTCLDNLASFTDEGGKLELWFVDEKGNRRRLNEPDGDLLTDLFNAVT